MFDLCEVLFWYQYSGSILLLCRCWAIWAWGCSKSLVSKTILPTSSMCGGVAVSWADNAAMFSAWQSESVCGPVTPCHVSRVTRGDGAALDITHNCRVTIADIGAVTPGIMWRWGQWLFYCHPCQFMFRATSHEPPRQFRLAVICGLNYLFFCRL